MKKFIVSLLLTATVFTCVACSSTTAQNPTSAPTQAATNAATDAATDAATEADNNNENNDAENNGEDLAATLSDLFLKEIATNTNIQSVVDILGEAADMNCISMQVEEGFLNGFSAEVKGFSEGYVFSPMIGSIPFIGYVFQTDDVDALVNTLKSLADPRWNICTMAKDPVIVTSGNYVFFTMCPPDEDDDAFGGFDF